MSQSTKAGSSGQFTPRAVLAAIGVKLQALDLFAPIREGVHIEQKVVKDTPVEKLYDAFITMLAGAQGMVQINTLLRADPALQAAIGRTRCAEQSVVQDTLDACTPQTVRQLEGAVDTIYQRHSQGYRHDYQRTYQVLDVDMSGMPCGRKAELATKGYFAKQRNRRGRQLGRVVASRYEEVVVDRVFAGTTQLAAALQPLMQAAERTLALAQDAARRARTILRVDAGGGSLADVNWALARGYRVHAKDYSAQRAQALAATVTTWVDDPRVPGRQVGWVAQDASAYVRAVRRIAVRCPKKNGQWGEAVLISALEPAEVLALTGQPAGAVDDPAAVLLAYVYFYDARGGAAETTFRGDKQGLGLTKRNKKRLAAQQMVVGLSSLAHNVLIWARAWLAPTPSALQHYGIKRLVRDVLPVSGRILTDRHTHQVRRIVLNAAHPLAAGLAGALRLLLAPQHVAVTLGQT
jgi:hypothetical protein